MAKAKNWAIVVGINKYDRIGHLNYANRDAEAMAQFFRSSGFDRVFCFADGLEIEPDQGQSSTQPRSSDLTTFLHERCTTKTKPLSSGDNFWFFFAGHGKRIRDCDYLLPQDYNPAIPNHENFAISVSFVRESLLKSGADNVILLLDACRTEGDRSDALGIGDEQPGAITFFSCDRHQKAYEIEALQHGAFTAALLEGLAMPKSDKNCATVQRLNRHLRDRVPQLCQLHPEKPIQNPRTELDEWKYYLLLLPKVATEQDIVALENRALSAEVAENLDLAEFLWRRCVAATGGEDDNALDGFARVREKKAKRQFSTAQTVTIAQQQSPPVKPIEPPTASRSPSQPQPPRPTPPPVKPSLPIVIFHSVTLDATGKQTARKPGKVTFFIEEIGNDITLDMVQIPGGSFQMGATKSGFLGRKEEGASDDEFPQHQVTVKDFWMGAFVITQKQWTAIAHPSNKVKIDLELDPSNWKGDKLPVEKVSWYEAKEFCDRLSIKTGKAFDLPTEAQWEYACRAGTTTPFHFGETIDAKFANYRAQDYKELNWSGKYGQGSLGEFRQKTMPVDSFDPNAFGLYNMHGNVWEWCLDPWHSNYDGAPKDDRVWDASNDSGSNLRLIRGGSWCHSPGNCRSAYRNRYGPAGQSSLIGFRVVCLSSRGPS